jgi:hypothetical protein
MRVVLFGLLAVGLGCKVNLDHGTDAGMTDANSDPRGCKVTTTAVCVSAADNNVSDFAWLQSNMFSTNCSGSDCHGAPDGDTAPSGGLSFATGFAYKALLGKDPADTGAAPLVPTDYDPEHFLVQPGEPDASYLLYILHGLPPATSAMFSPPPDDVGFMPQNNNQLCCQKLDAVSRWIAAGANP